MDSFSRVEKLDFFRIKKDIYILFLSRAAAAALAKAAPGGEQRRWGQGVGATASEVAYLTPDPVRTRNAEQEEVRVGR